MFDFERMKARAKQKHVPITELGELIGKNKFYLYDARNKGTNLSRDIIEKIARALDTTPAYLCGETDTPEVVNDTEEFVDIYRLINGRPATKLLFSALKDATDEDIEQTLAILQALKATNGR